MSVLIERRRRMPPRVWLLVALVAAAAVAAVVARSPAAAAPKPTVVLVHGGFEDARVWARVVPRLEAGGYRIVTPRNPLRGLPQDTAHLKKVLASVDGPVVLVAHGYGGMVISGIAGDHPTVKALVYVAAHAPDAGDNLLSLFLLAPGGRLQPSLLTLRRIPGTAPGDTQDEVSHSIEGSIPANVFRAVVAADLPARQAARMAASQRPMLLAAFTDLAGAPAWKTIPSWYLVPGRDRALGAAAERVMARRMNARTTVIKGASHAVPLSRPAATAKLIARAAGG